MFKLWATPDMGREGSDGHQTLDLHIISICFTTLAIFPGPQTSLSWQGAVVLFVSRPHRQHSKITPDSTYAQKSFLASPGDHMGC